MFKYLLLIVGLLAVKPMLAQNIDDSIFIVKVLGNSFNNTDTIFISLENKTDNKLFIQISLLKKINHKWQEVLPDIFKVNSDAILNNVLYFNPKEKRIEFWLPLLMQKNKKPIKGEYKFRLNVGKSPNLKEIRKNTTPFILK